MSDNIKVLFLAANPQDTARMQLDEELRTIFLAMGESDRFRFKVAVAPALRTTDLPTTILRENPDIIHYSGHGSNGEILLAADVGSMEPVGAENLARIFKTFVNRTRCVVLNACFSESVATAIAASVPVVVGMSRAVPDRGAREFAAGFYSALVNGDNVTHSFASGQERLVRSGSTGELAQLLAKEGTADTLYFTGVRAHHLEAPPPRQATGFASLAGLIDFQPLTFYARMHGIDHSTMRFENIWVAGTANNFSIFSQTDFGKEEESQAKVATGASVSITDFGNESKPQAKIATGTSVSIDDLKKAIEQSELPPTDKRKVLICLRVLPDLQETGMIDEAKEMVVKLRSMLAPQPMLLDKFDAVCSSLLGLCRGFV